MNIETIKWENDITHILNIRYPILLNLIKEVENYI